MTEEMIKTKWGHSDSSLMDFKLKAWREDHRFAVGILTKGCTEIPAVTEWLCPVYTETCNECQLTMLLMQVP